MYIYIYIYNQGTRLRATFVNSPPPWGVHPPGGPVGGTQASQIQLSKQGVPRRCFWVPFGCYFGLQGLSLKVLFRSLFVNFLVSGVVVGKISKYDSRAGGSTIFKVSGYLKWCL